MQGKMSDSNLKYFIAISENKKRDLELRTMENKIDNLRKKMLSRYWKDKINVFDDMIRLNVKTPTYDGERAASALSRGDNFDDETQSMSMGPMNIDSKLLSNRPVTLQRGHKGGGRIEPVISIEGTDAVCYPNKEAKRGRKVGLNQGMLRRLEQCKALEENIASIRCKSATRRDEEMIMRRNGSLMRRPRTAPGLGKKKGSKNSEHGVPESNTTADDNERRPSTSIGSYKREGFITAPATTLRRSTSSASVRSRTGRMTPR